MRNLFFTSLFALIFVACGNKSTTTSTTTTTTTPSTETTTNAAATLPKDLKISWEFTDKGVDKNENPQTAVALVVNGKKFEIAQHNQMDNIAPDQYKQYQMPAEAISACGGWWAGFGDYYYVVKQGDKLVVMYTAIGEEEGSKYDYQPKKEITPKDLQ